MKFCPAVFYPIGYVPAKFCLSVYAPVKLCRYVPTMLFRIRSIGCYVPNLFSLVLSTLQLSFFGYVPFQQCSVYGQSTVPLDTFQIYSAFVLSTLRFRRISYIFVSFTIPKDPRRSNSSGNGVVVSNGW